MKEEGVQGISRFVYSVSRASFVKHAAPVKEILHDF